MNPLASVAAMCDLAANETPLHAVTLIAYLDADGDECIRMAELGDTTLTNELGLLAWAQYRLASDHCSGEAS